MKRYDKEERCCTSAKQYENLIRFIFSDDLDFYEEYLIYLTDKEQAKFLENNTEFMSEFPVSHDRIYLLRDETFRALLRRIKRYEERNMKKILEFDTVILKEPDSDRTYVEVPFDVKEVFGKSRVPVQAMFDGEPYSGQVIKKGMSSHHISVRKDICKKIEKRPGDKIHVTLEEREHAEPLFSSVEEYINSYDKEIRERMETLRKIILNCSPEITEKISWGMATFVLNGNLVHFAGEKKHIGFHPAPSAIEAFKHRLGDYKYSKGTVQLPYDKPMPYELLSEMTMFRVQEQKKK